MNAPTDNRPSSESFSMRVLSYRKAWAGLESAVAIWLVILGGTLLRYGYLWGAAVLAAAALPLWAVYWLLRGAQS